MFSAPIKTANRSRQDRANDFERETNLNTSPRCRQEGMATRQFDMTRCSAPNDRIGVMVYDATERLRLHREVLAPPTFPTRRALPSLLPASGPSCPSSLLFASTHQFDWGWSHARTHRIKDHGGLAKLSHCSLNPLNQKSTHAHLPSIGTL